MINNKKSWINMLVLLGTIFVLISAIAYKNRTELVQLAKRNAFAKKVMGRVISKYRLRSAYSNNNSKYKKSSPSLVRITIDAQKSLGKYERFWGGIGMDSFNDGILRSFNQAFFDQMAETNQKHKNSFNYVRLCGIFAERLAAWKEDIGAHVYQENTNGEISYNWSIVDKVFDTLLQKGFIPIISLTYMPDKLGSIPQKQNPWNLANVSPPKDYHKWRNLIYETIRHLKERYGSEEIKKWYFEVWNEPDLPEFFWVTHPNTKDYLNRGDNQEYFKLYDYAVDGALAADSSIKIGGPAIAGDIELFLKPFLEHCLSGKNCATGKVGTRIDFVSRHSYGAIEDQIVPSIKAFIGVTSNYERRLPNKLKILITEIGPSTIPKQWLNSRYVSAWIVKKVAAFFYLGDKYGRDYLPTITCFWTKPVEINFGNHFSLATVIGDEWAPSANALVKRPAFNAYEALGYLGNERIELTGTDFGDQIHGIATKNEKSLLAIILYHLDEYDCWNSDSTFHDINLTIKNLPYQKCYVSQYRIDEHHSNGYTAWKESGSPLAPAPEVLIALQKKDDLELYEPIAEKIINEGILELTMKIQNNSVILLTISKENTK